MTITVGGSAITFPDATTQSTAATAPTTTQVLNAYAGASVGAVGTYTIGYFYITSAPANRGSNFAAGSGNNQVQSVVLGVNNCLGAWNVAATIENVLSGTWKLLNTTTTSGNTIYIALFLRVA